MRNSDSELELLTSGPPFLNNLLNFLHYLFPLLIYLCVCVFVHNVCVCEIADLRV